MIANKVAAAEVSALMIEIGALINESVAMVRTRCGAAEFEPYQSACDTVLMHILMDIVMPIHDLHPELSTGSPDRKSSAAAPHSCADALPAESDKARS